jgi:hypothetical protein
MLTERDKQIIKDITKKPMQGDKFIKYYGIDVAQAHRLTKQLCICRDGMIRVR